MSGNELITITIEDQQANEVMSCRYNILSAGFYNLTKEEYHLMMLNNLIERFNKRKHETD